MKNPSAPLVALLSLGLISLSSSAALAQVRLQVEPYRGNPSDTMPAPNTSGADDRDAYVFQPNEPSEATPPPMEKRRRPRPSPQQPLPRSLHVDAPTE